MSYNLEKVYLIAEGSQEFIQEVVITFIEEVPQDIKILENAIKNSEFSMIYQICHKLKPNLDLFGMQNAYAFNLQLLGWAKAKTDLDKMFDIFGKMNTDLHENMKELKKEFNL